MTQNAPRVVTLGTAGGPRWWPRLATPRAGISTAVEVGGRVYLVDTGHGAGRQLTSAGFGMDDLGAILLTHLHSDHTTDLANVAIFGMFSRNPQLNPVPILGPGDRGVLPRISPRAVTPPTPVSPALPTPGTKDMFRLLMEANATDLNDRVLDALRPSPFDLFDARDIEVPTASGYHPNDNPTPAMDPFTVFTDDRVQIDAILVEHPPIAPAFAFRISCDEGAVVISGDTAPTPNMVRLAHDADLLLHEAIDFDWVDEQYAGRTDQTAQASRDHHRKSHTSVREAMVIAAEANVTQLAVHHVVPGDLAREKWLAATVDAPVPTLIPNDLDSIVFARRADRVSL